MASEDIKTIQMEVGVSIVLVSYLVPARFILLLIGTYGTNMKSSLIWIQILQYLPKTKQNKNISLT